LLLLISLAASGWTQTAPGKKPLAGCVPVRRKHGSILAGPFKFRPGESYQHAPTIQFQITEEGKTVHAEIVRSSGVSDIDSKAVAAISYGPRTGCGTLDSEIALLIHWQ
jgi:hypothetical protein